MRVPAIGFFTGEESPIEKAELMPVLLPHRIYIKPSGPLRIAWASCSPPVLKERCLTLGPAAVTPSSAIGMDHNP